MVDHSTYADLLYTLRELRRDYPNFEKVNQLFSIVQHSVLGHLLEDQRSIGLDLLEAQFGIDTATDLNYQNIAPLILEACQELERSEVRSWLVRVLKPFEHEFVRCGTETDCRLLTLVAGALNKIGSLPELRLLLDRARPWVESNADSRTLCDFTNYDSFCLFFDGRHAEAIESITRAISLAEEVGYPFAEAAAYHTFGQIYAWQGRFSDAIEKLLVALKKFETVDSIEGQSRVLGMLSQNYGSIFDYEMAEITAKKALHLAEQCGKVSAIRLAHFFLASLALSRGDYSHSLELAKRALALHSAEQSMAAQADVLRILGVCYINLGLFTNALSSLDEAQELYGRAGVKLGELSTLRIKTHMALYLGEIDWALETLDRTITQSKRQGMQSEFANSCLDRAALLAEKGQFEASLVDLAEAHRAIEALRNQKLLGHYYEAQGRIYSSVARWNESLTAFKKALEVFKGLGVVSKATECSLSISNIYLHQSDQGISLVEAMPFVESVTQSIESGQIQNTSMASRAESMFERVAELSEDWQRAFELCQFQLNTLKESDSTETRTKLQSSIVRREREQLETERTQKEAAQRELIALMLPEPISAELLTGKRYVANTYPAVSILLLDIVGFTNFASRATNTQIITFLNRFFSGIDAICRDTGVEKIKTIGDAYLACCGAPYPDVEHAKKIFRSAKAILEFVERFNSDPGISGLLSFFSDGLQVRIGLHSGSVIGGVVGLDRYQFDLWGDAVDRVKEIESAAEPNTIMRTSEFEEALRKAR